MGFIEEGGDDNAMEWHRTDCVHRLGPLDGRRAVRGRRERFVTERIPPLPSMKSMNPVETTRQPSYIALRSDEDIVQV